MTWIEHFNASFCIEEVREISGWFETFWNGQIRLSISFQVYFLYAFQCIENGDTEYSTVIKTFVEDYRHLYQNTCQPLKDLLESMLLDDVFLFSISFYSQILPSMVSQGNFIKKGYDPELDELRSLHESIQDTISSLEVFFLLLIYLQ